jgi:hypothetical protein
MFRKVRANLSFSPVDFSNFVTNISQKDLKTGYIIHAKAINDIVKTQD